MILMETRISSDFEFEGREIGKRHLISIKEPDKQLLRGI